MAPPRVGAGPRSTPGAGGTSAPAGGTSAHAGGTRTDSGSTFAFWDALSVAERYKASQKDVLDSLS